MKYAEERDLRENNCSGDQNTASSTSSTTGIDWIDSWQSPDHVHHQQLAQEVQDQAKRARATLNQAIRNLQIDDDSRSRRMHRRENALRLALAANGTIAGKNRKRKLVESSLGLVEPTGQDFCVADYHSDEDVGGENACRRFNSMPLAYDSDDEPDSPATASRRKLAVIELLLNGAALDGSLALKKSVPVSMPPPSPVGRVEPGSGICKIIYAARTHSQLSQFVAEFSKTSFAKTHRILALGGRKSLCTNPDVQKLASESAITEACLDLKGKCPNKQGSALTQLALHTLSHPTPIEDALELGRNCGICAYYAARAALPAAHVVVMPYSMLLSPQTRQAIGLSLKGAIVVVDEAHNLPEALRSLHSATLTLPVVQSAISQLSAYVERYGQRLAGRNLMYLGQLAKFCKAVVKYLEKVGRASIDSTTKLERRMATPEELQNELRLGNMNLYKILRYMERSRLSQKLMGFRNHQGLNGEQSSNESSSVPSGGSLGPDGLSKHVSAMSIVQTFIEKISLCGQEGKVVVDVPRRIDSHEDSTGHSANRSHLALRYVLLLPASFFENILDEALALALVGGTLRPFAHVATELLGSGGDWIQRAASADAKLQKSLATRPSEAIVEPGFTAFTCDHVVSPSNVLLQCLSVGPTGTTLDFRHQSRSTHLVCDELGKVVQEICRIVPNGVVVFLPSYNYEASVVQRWKKTGLWENLCALKRVHREPKDTKHLDTALRSFQQDAEQGALLFSVIGAKFSEGINFANEMARCVLVVGLPYPDVTDPVLQEKMANLDASPDKAISGQEYYRNLTLRAVNQTVGRAIRHANDFAAIVLADSRYTSDPRVWAGLPNWLKKGVSSQAQMKVPFTCNQQQLQDFFTNKRVNP